MKRRQFLTALAVAPVALAAAQDTDLQARIDQRNLIASMVDFEDRWSTLLEDYADSNANKWDIKQAAEVEKYFRKMTSQPGWISGHKA
jgi:hypothetical protein